MERIGVVQPDVEGGPSEHMLDGTGDTFAAFLLQVRKV
jgi:hypothetical protein